MKIRLEDLDDFDDLNLNELEFNQKINRKKAKEKKKTPQKKEEKKE